MEKFLIELIKKVRQDNDLYYVEFSPQNEYEDKVRKFDIIPLNEIEDYIYLEGVKTEMYNILEDMYGKEFTDKYEL